ncbi:unnamed protein product [Didymodactylos carnosus]|uniref:Flavin-containing monooxygenase n=1 Tax=Didymodactylos carnosus TaxID=1234261 RepID=A0A814C5W6_9BILA|nr:unnamed protein product [Didymodactylos carnosus]CAF0937396.1 unnamed protein product [Didymodactylos carnosus]CAF3549871.1 unnamed protein product [Didymodactylos carnosus]CAF3714382.1 unnamed protein product [Didymodactylos carnosus]
MNNSNSSKHRKVNVGIIGGGASGLVTLKELLAEGHQGTVFEKSSNIGGIFNTVYQQGQMVSSNLVTMFGDFVGDEREYNDLLKSPRMWTFIEYSKYLVDYAEKFHLIEHIKLNSAVKSVWRRLEDGKWNVEINDEAQSIYEFDRLAVCSGTHQLRSMPKFKGVTKFQGKIKHLQDVCTFEEFRDKRCCIVGSGESASDMALASAKYGKQSFLSIRQDHGVIVKRYGTGSYGPADLGTNRVRYSIPFRLGLLHVSIMLIPRLLLSFVTPADTLEKRIIRKQHEMNFSQLRTSHFRNTYGTKNAGLVEAILEYHCQRKPAIKELRERTIVFDDNTEEECDEIVCCTGYENEFSFLLHTGDELLMKVANDARIPHNLYKHCIHPEIGDQLFFIGFVRPCFGAIPPLAEMQARWFALLCSEKLSLPPKETMYQHSQLYVKYLEEYFTPYRTDRIVNLTDFISYSDDLARLLGCRPNFVEMFFKQPKLWLKCQLGPMLNAQYRLCGPHANRKQAEEIILQSKWVYYDFYIYIELFLLFFSSLFYLLFGIKKCKPNIWYPIVDDTKHEAKRK